MAECQYISNNEVLTESMDVCRGTDGDRRMRFIYDAQFCSSSSSALSSLFGVALTQNDKKRAPNQMVCIDYEYYIVICVLFMLTFASFICFVVMGLNKLKQLRESSHSHF